MIVYSAVEPGQVEPDMGSISLDGWIDVLVHWDINLVDGQYQYEEERIRRPLPAGIRAESDVTAYLTGQYDRLLLLAGADVIPTRISDLEVAVLDLAGAML